MASLCWQGYTATLRSCLHHTYTSLCIRGRSTCCGTCGCLVCALLLHLMQVCRILRRRSSVRCFTVARALCSHRRGLGLGMRCGLWLTTRVEFSLPLIMHGVELAGAKALPSCDPHRQRVFTVNYSKASLPARMYPSSHLGVVVAASSACERQADSFGSGAHGATFRTHDRELCMRG